jgi:hypothetical protein
MLTHFGCGADVDTVLGDLAEQYQRKNSAMWYWRQVLKTIPMSFVREIRGHKWIAARALVLGWAIWVLFVMLIFPYLTRFFLDGSFSVFIEPRDPIATVMTIVSAPIGVQQNVDRPFSNVLAFVLPFIVWVTCGWLVARFHRAQRTSVVLLFAASILVFGGHFAIYSAAAVLGILLGGGVLSGSGIRVIRSEQ